MFKQLIVASIVTASLAGAARAQESDIRTVTVSIAGINTHSQSGATVMLQRIKVAAGTVCGPAPSNGLDRRFQYDPCVTGVTQRTVAGLNNPVLTALLNTDVAQMRKLASAR
jgi:UrcA family protein